MKIKLKLFAMLSERLPAGAEDHTMELEVPDGATTHQIVRLLGIPPELATLTLLDGVHLTQRERDQLLDDWLNVCEWVPVFFLWRPNLPDEGDNHLIELAVAGMAGTIVTENVRDLRGGELRFPGLVAETPAEFMARWRGTHGHDDDSAS